MPASVVVGWWERYVVRNATIFCVNFTFANFASPYSIANIRSQTLNKNLWAWFLVCAVNEHRINSSSSRPIMDGLKEQRRW